MVDFVDKPSTDDGRPSE